MRHFMSEQAPAVAAVRRGGCTGADRARAVEPVRAAAAMPPVPVNLQP